jgi:hypothetical protein
MLDSDTIAAFDVRPDPHCLRGLHLLYSVPRLAAERLVHDIRTAFPHHLFETSERWGPVTVHRLVFQFRFEIQLGARRDEISFLHRVLASPGQRARDRAWFEATLIAISATERRP